MTRDPFDELLALEERIHRRESFWVGFLVGVFSATAALMLIRWVLL